MIISATRPQCHRALSSVSQSVLVVDAVDLYGRALSVNHCTQAAASCVSTLRLLRCTAAAAANEFSIQYPHRLASLFLARRGYVTSDFGDKSFAAGAVRGRGTIYRITTG